MTFYILLISNFFYPYSSLHSHQISIFFFASILMVVGPKSVAFVSHYSLPNTLKDSRIRRISLDGLGTYPFLKSLSCFKSCLQCILSFITLLHLTSIQGQLLHLHY